MAIRLAKSGGGEALGVGVIQVDDLRVRSRRPTDRSPASSCRGVGHNDEERRCRAPVSLLPYPPDRDGIGPRLGGPVSDFQSTVAPTDPIALGRDTLCFRRVIAPATLSCIDLV